MTNKPATQQDSIVRVLHVDDDLSFTSLTKDCLEQEEDRISVETAADANQGLEILMANEFDCVVSDYEMPGRNGLEFLETIRQANHRLPFILFTSRQYEEITSNTTSTKVTNYVYKRSGTDQFTELANRIIAVVEE